MAVLLSYILCPILFGISFIIQTAYFLYKVLSNRYTDYAGKEPVTTIPMTDFEATCCMGWAWTSCIDKTTNRMTLKTFTIWYIVCVTLDILLTVVLYLIIDHYYKIYV